MEKYMTVEMLRERLGISRSTAYNLVKRPDFPSIQVGKKIIISETALQAWLDNGGTKQK